MEVCYADHEPRLAIIDDGRSAPPIELVPGGGHAIVGMLERMARRPCARIA